MKKQINFQINPLDKQDDWEKVPVLKRFFEDRDGAAKFARQMAALYKAEVRLTEGSDAFKVSGSYFR